MPTAGKPELTETPSSEEMFNHSRNARKTRKANNSRKINNIRDPETFEIPVADGTSTVEGRLQQQRPIQQRLQGRQQQ
jgi:hypothetical protein